MNNDNPLIPQGSLFEEKAKSQARVKKAFFFALSASVLTLLVALIAQGCKREQPQLPAEPPIPAPTFDTNYPPAVDTNLPPPAMDTNVLPPVVDTTPVTPAPITPPAAATSTSEYVVAKGDSFYTIAKKFGVSTKAIGDANPGVDSKKLQIGQKLNIPAASAAPAVATPGGAPAPAANGGTTETYTVKSGDNLTKIAGKFGVSIKALRSANNLKTDRIKVGDKLKIPAKASAPVATPEPAPAPVTAPPVTLPAAPAPTATPSPVPSNP